MPMGSSSKAINTKLPKASRLSCPFDVTPEASRAEQNGAKVKVFSSQGSIKRHCSVNTNTTRQHIKTNTQVGSTNKAKKWAIINMLYYFTAG